MISQRGEENRVKVVMVVAMMVVVVLIHVDDRLRGALIPVDPQRGDLRAGADLIVVVRRGDGSVVAIAGVGITIMPIAATKVVIVGVLSIAAMDKTTREKMMAKISRKAVERIMLRIITLVPAAVPRIMPRI
jgi:hypothetical protein